MPAPSASISQELGLQAKATRPSFCLWLLLSCFILWDSVSEGQASLQLLVIPWPQSHKCWHYTAIMVCFISAQAVSQDIIWMHMSTGRSERRKGGVTAPDQGQWLGEGGGWWGLTLPSCPGPVLPCWPWWAPPWLLQGLLWVTSLHRLGTSLESSWGDFCWSFCMSPVHTEDASMPTWWWGNDNNILLLGD